ncbi:hypothetical protein CAPTEDRAFT_213400 [Capitella teleta]|uniref:Uncharacterized protein n=1 Tax=Capitella teleta TaxID=283909 RepID=R7UPH6_CAPTE|nr:hypothetical protein CAPTEDRAFT_213400 [Capitella teleta]|eukprot:ELU08065.1 hypothetical protein CAPTEDRAFT_213400 [Capitella teleta]
MGHRQERTTTPKMPQGKKTVAVIWLLMTCSMSDGRVWRDFGIGPPDFDSDWLLMKAQDDGYSYRIRRHNLGEIPWKVRVFVMILDGEYNGSIFEAASGGAMWDDDNGIPYCGVAYVFNNESIKMFAPHATNSEASGRIACAGGSAWGNAPEQFMFEANVRALAWRQRSFPEPDFMTDWIPMDETQGILEVPHNITGGCSYMMVQTKGLSNTKSSGVWHGEAVGASQDPYDIYDRAAVVFGYNGSLVRIWRAINTNGQTKLPCFLCVRDGWTFDKKITVTSGEVRIIGWSSLFVSDINNSIHRELLVGGSGPMSYTVQLPAEVNPQDFVSVQVMSLEGPNGAFKFPAFGIAPAIPPKSSIKTYGGVVYFTKGSQMTIYLPTGKRGYPVNILSPWGGGFLTQTSTVVKILINVYYASTIELDSCHFSQLDKDPSIRSGVEGAGRHIHCARQCCRIEGCGCIGFQVDARGTCTPHEDLLDLHMNRDKRASFLRSL